MLEPNGWNEWSKYVLNHIEQQGITQKEIYNMLSDIKTDMAVLKLKASVWGAAAGMIPVAIMLLIQLLSKAG